MAPRMCGGMLGLAGAVLGVCWVAALYYAECAIDNSADIVRPIQIQTQGAAMDHTQQQVHRPFKFPTTAPSELNVLLLTVPLSPIHSALGVGVELDRRGHRVTVGSMVEVKDKVLQHNLAFAALGSYGDWTDLLGEITETGGKFSHYFEVTKRAMSLTDIMVEHLEKLYPLPSVQGDTIHPVTYPDVVYCHVFYTPRLNGFMQARGIQYILSLTSFVVPFFSQQPLYASLMGGAVDPTKRTLVDTALVLLQRAVAETAVRVAWAQPAKYLRHFLQLPHKPLVLFTTVPGMDYPMHLPPLVRYTGPTISRQREQLNVPAGLGAYLEAHAGTPIVYVSMGTMAVMSQAQVHYFAEGLRPPHDTAWVVVWALRGPEHSKLPEFVHSHSAFYIAEWIETPSVLSKDDVKAFVTHCGSGGVHESIYYGVPIVGTPLFGDQVFWCHRIEHANLGRCLGKGFFETKDGKSPADLTSALQQVIGNNDIQRKVAGIQLLMDKFYTGAPLAADWIEYAAHGDLNILETPLDRHGAYHAYGGHVMLLVLGCVLVMLKLLQRCVLQRKPVNKSKQEESKKRV